MHSEPEALGWPVPEASVKVHFIKMPTLFASDDVGTNKFCKAAEWLQLKFPRSKDALRRRGWVGEGERGESKQEAPASL